MLECVCVRVRVCVNVFVRAYERVCVPACMLLFVRVCLCVGE